MTEIFLTLRDKGGKVREFQVLFGEIQKIFETAGLGLQVDQVQINSVTGSDARTEFRLRGCLVRDPGAHPGPTPAKEEDLLEKEE